MQVGALVEGEVVKIAQYGAYVRLDNLKCTGLLHVSNISKQFVGAAGDVFSVGERIKCIIAGYEAGFKQISLSTAELEGSPGQMVQDKAAVMSAAKDQAREFQQFLSDYVEGHEVSRQWCSTVSR